MPIYEYQCEECQHHFDALQKMSDEPLRTCPQCHQLRLKKMVSAPHFKLTGTGWYETDFKNKKESKVNDDMSTSVPVDTKNEAKSVEPASTVDVKPVKAEPESL